MGIGSSKITNQDRAILDMKIQRDKLKQYQKRIQVILDREREIAKEGLGQNDKSRALLALRRRKYQEQLLLRTDQQLEALERLTNSVEFALVEKDVVYGLKQGNKVLTEINKEMSLESVEQLMDETEGAIAYQNEVSDMLASRITNADEEDVLEELAALERQALPKVPSEPLPEVADAESEPSGQLRRPEAERKHAEPLLA